MGLLFAFILQLLIVLFISTVLGVIAGCITALVCNPEKRKRKILVAFLSPYFFLITFGVSGLIGSIAVSMMKNIDIGVGDCWRVPLSDNYLFMAIDEPDVAYIRADDAYGGSLVDGITEIQLTDSLAVGKTTKQSYFTFNIHNAHIRNYTTEEELEEALPELTLDLHDSSQFISERYESVAGGWLMGVGIFALCMACGVVYLLKKLVLR